MANINQRIKVTKKLLKEGLLRLLEVKNIDKVNVTELCKESGINRSTFYAHYETPHQLLLEIEQDIIQDLYKMQNQKSNPSYQAYTESMCQYLYERKELIRVLIRNFSDRDLANILTQAFQDTIDSIVDVDVDRDNLKLASAYLAGGGYFLLMLWLQEDIQKTPKEIATLITSLFSENILVKKYK